MATVEQTYDLNTLPKIWSRKRTVDKANLFFATVLSYLSQIILTIVDNGAGGVPSFWTFWTPQRSFFLTSDVDVDVDVGLSDGHQDQK